MDDNLHHDIEAGAACGPDGCDTENATPTNLSRAEGVGTRIDIVSDTICPWCYIGKRNLESALATLALEGIEFTVHWNPFQLNPDMAKEGRDRAAYRAWKFGSAEKAKAIDARIQGAAEAAGLNFRQDLMTRTPNTIDAHRLIWFAGQQGVQDATMETVFKAYFMQGKDVGDRAVLADCAAEAGLDRAEVLAFLASDVADKEMNAADQSAREAGVTGVPSFFLDGYSVFSGAMPPEHMVQAFRRGQQVLREQAAKAA